MLTAITTTLLHLMRGWATVPRLSAVVAIMLGVHGRVQVHIEREDVEAKHQCNDPLDDRSRVIVLVITKHDERNGQADGDENEGQLDPKGDGEHAMLGVVHAEALVLGADEDGRDEVADDEKAQKDVVQTGVVRGIEDTEADKADGAHQGPDDGEAGQDFLAQGGVGYKAAAVAKPAVGEEGGIEEDGGNDTACDEERLELAGTDV